MGSARLGQSDHRGRLLLAALCCLVLAGAGVLVVGLQSSHGTGVTQLDAAGGRTIRPAGAHHQRTRGSGRDLLDQAAVNPPANVAPNPDYTFQSTEAGSIPQGPAPACWDDTASGWVPVPGATACLDAEVQATNAARRTEGLGPLHLPSDYAGLTAPEQLFVVTNLERVARGEPAVVGLAPSLGPDAAQGAKAGTDPRFRFAAIRTSTWWGSNWATGVLNALDANYTWMYADGPGGDNIECPYAGASGCWGHRDNILTSTHGGTLVMGAASVPLGTGLQSMSELLVAVQNPRDVPKLSYTWSEAVAAGAAG